MPGCRAPATKVLNKTHLCADCWEKEKARMNAIYDSLPN